MALSARSKDIKKAMEQITPGKGESIENIAQRMFDLQNEINSVYSGRDLDIPFDSLSEEDRAGWIKAAKEKF